MSDFKITQEAIDRLNAAFETDSAKGMVRLIEIVRNAADDPFVAKSKLALEMVEVMLGVLLTDHVTAIDSHEPLERLAEAVRSVQNSVFASKKRNRKLSPWSAKSFAEAVKKAAGKKPPHHAIKWLENNIDRAFDGFDVIAVSNGKIRYRFDGKEYEITTATFEKKSREKNRRITG